MKSKDQILLEQAYSNVKTSGVDVSTLISEDADMNNPKKTEAQKQLIKFRNQLHNLLIKYPEIRLSAGLDGDVYAQITPSEPHALTEYIYLPTSGKQELISK